MQELRRFVINLKSLDQDIPDAIAVGAGDANGRTLAVILTQEAAARFTPMTRLYLSWKHEDTKIQGLDVFKKVKDKPATWEIKYPQEMLTKGKVFACLKVVDEISIDCSTGFIIHVLEDPNDDETLEDSESYSLFKDAALELNNTNELMKQQIERQEKDFQRAISWFDELADRVQAILDTKIGVLPEDVSNYLEYIEKVQEEQDRNFEENIQKAEDGMRENLESALSLQVH